MDFIDYVVVEASEDMDGRSTSLRVEVGKLLELGWVLYGNPMISGNIVKQVMVKPKPLKYDPTFMMDDETRAWLDTAVNVANFMKKKGFTSLGPVTISN